MSRHSFPPKALSYALPFLAVLLLSGASSAANGKPSSPPGQAAAVNSIQPSISGSTVAGETLVASNGTWTGASIEYAFQWYRCDASGSSCHTITAATNATYVSIGADIGLRLRVTVIATTRGGSAAATSDATQAITPAPVVVSPPPLVVVSPRPLPATEPSSLTAPSNITLPALSGVAQQEATLSATTGTWSGEPTYDLQWKRCDASGGSCAAIANTGSTYVLATSDVGGTVRVTVVATNSGGTTSATSLASQVVSAPLPAATQIPQITGLASVGQTLISSTGSWSGSPTSYAYQWKRCDTNGDSCVDVPLGIKASYVAVTADVGYSIRVTVTATNAAGSASAVSNHTLGVAAAATTPSTDNDWGIATGGDPVYYDDAKLARYLDSVRALGVRFVRTDIGLRGIFGSSTNATNGLNSPDWGSTDRYVDAVHSRGMRVLWILATTPDWAAAPGYSGTWAPWAKPAQFGEAARKVVERYYTRGVTVYEIWNEPNYARFFGDIHGRAYTETDIAIFAGMMKAAYTGMKTQQPGATIIGPGLAQAGSYQQGGGNGWINDQRFLEKLYANGIKGYFDALSYHPYGDFHSGASASRYYDYAGAADDWVGWNKLSQTPNSIRSIMIANGDGDKKIWATEIGAPAKRDYEGAWTQGTGTTETEQAAIAAQIGQRWKSLSYAGGLMWYAGKDGSTAVEEEARFGLLRSDWTEKPAYVAYKNSIAAYGGGS